MIRGVRDVKPTHVVVLRQLKTPYGELELRHNNGHWTVTTVAKRVGGLVDGKISHEFYPKAVLHKFHQNKEKALAFYDEKEREIALAAAMHALSI